ncbi:hypothetical protein ACIQXI_05110 [Lysinibacillus sp. NPDC097195]|uniref:hypothetical protein n=1 Tax=Lysinibacillus sp. NPDC097195 TaxID=3364141 RepID=UPI003803F2B1
MQILFLTLVVISNLFPHPETLQEQSTTTTICEPITTAKTTYQYPSNHFQPFLVAEEYYTQLDKSIFENYDNATFILQKKILFKEVTETQKNFNVKTNLTHEIMDLSNHTMIHPNRQVYFLASFTQNAQEEFHKFIVIDAETNNILLADSIYTPIR